MKEPAERYSWVVVFPVLATVLFYALPSSSQQRVIVQFLPQLLAYVTLTVWAVTNTDVPTRLGLSGGRLRSGILWGALTGLGLGLGNTLVVLWTVPALGGDLAFLRDTPHAQVPTALMVPWVILAIATAVELNFRGFLLGRLQAVASLVAANVFGKPRPEMGSCFGSALAVGSSALVFAFDPFLVSTFRHLHWIAVWDGLVWGWMRLRFGTLYAVITAHAIEVIVVYLCVKTALT